MKKVPWFPRHTLWRASTGWRWKGTLPAIEGIYCRASLDLQLTGYNLETAITVSAQADIQEQGACILPARLLFDIIRRLPEGPVSVRVDDHYKVNIRAGFSNFNISASNAEDYPELPDVESRNGVSIPQSALREMISGTIFAVSEIKAAPSTQDVCLRWTKPPFLWWR